MRQGLHEVAPTSADTLERAGWARSVGGANPYLTLFARSQLKRSEIDRAASELKIHELPAARGCTYVVPERDFALALKVGQGFGEEASIATARKFLGVTDVELERLEERILAALSGATLDPKALKEVLGDAVRSLGEEGKKRGQTTTLPLGLGRLQSQGKIRRIPVTGRFDQQRYAYTAWLDNPLNGYQLSREDAFVELARRFWSWIGPATVANFQWFSGLGVRSARDAVAALGLVPIIEGSSFLIDPSELDEFHAFQIPSEPSYALLASIDSLFLLRRELAQLLDASDESQAMFGEKLYTLGGIMELVNHGIVDRGRIVGLWEFDPFAQVIVWRSFGPANSALRACIERTEALIRQELGDARSFSLDSPQSRQPKLAFLRQFTGQN